MSARGPMRNAFGGRGPMVMMPDVKARDFKGTIRRLAVYLGRRRIAILVVAFLALISSALSVAGPKTLGLATTALFNGSAAKPRGAISIDFTVVGTALCVTAALYLASALLSYLQGWIMSGIAVRLSYQMRADIGKKIDRIPLSYFDGTSHGDILSRISNDVDTLSQTMSQSLTQIVSSAATVVGVLLMMLIISPLLTLLALVVIPISLSFISFIIKRSQKLFKKQQDYLGLLNGHIEEMYGAHFVVKAYNGEARSIATFNQLNDELYGSVWKSQFLSGLMMPIMTAVGNLGYVGVVIFGGALALRGTIAVGDIQAFIQYLKSFQHPINQLANITNVLQLTAASAERVFEFLDLPEEASDQADTVKPENIQGTVRFNSVHFGYTPERTIIKDFSTLAESGKKIAIVGPTGAGKTTLVKLLMRFYEIDGGSITIDGQDIRSFKRAELRRLFGMVLQDTWLFNGSVMENIRYGRPDADDEAVYAAARMAHADHFIRAHPMGYSQIINEEADNLSQGQKQLLTIARAVLADPPMLILDEATSSVDTRTEILIQRAMDRLMRNRTSFVIAHRLSTVKNADLILVIKDGNIVEQGTHKELLAKNGFYADIYVSQFDRVANTASR